MSNEWYVDSKGILWGPKVLDPGQHLLPEGVLRVGVNDINPWSIILHSQSGSKPAKWYQLWAYLNKDTVDIEPHFILDSDGWLVQTMPLGVKADCNYKANRWKVKYGNGAVPLGAISFETADQGSATLEDTPWTMEQVDTLVNAIAAIGHKYGIPYQECVGPFDQGVDYHSKFTEWSVYKGKTCPGRARIHQIPWIRAAAAAKCAC